VLNTPVLFIIFNRPETTVQVFEAIRRARPIQLFVAADGPRAGKEGEKERCEEARRIATNVDWECEVKTLFRDENIGCGRGPAEAITWFFEHVEQGIILEDDCLPSNSFFKFCEELLIKYRYDEKIMEISGMNFLKKMTSDTSYFFSAFGGGTWGWATWRRAWIKYDYYLTDWTQSNATNKISNFFVHTLQKDAYKKIFDQTYKMNNVSWWDYQWFYKKIMNDGLGIVPKANMISNIGFGDNATHTFDVNSKNAKLKLHELFFPLKHPQSVIKNEIYDEKMMKKDIPQTPSVFSRLKRKIESILVSVGYTNTKNK
jgi:hypothetical protein